MTKEIHQQQKQPMHSAIIGLALLLGWFMVSYMFTDQGLLENNDATWDAKFYNLFFEHFIFFKLYTLIAFIFGIRAYIYTEEYFTDRLFYQKTVLWVLVAIMLSFIHFVALALIPLFAFGVLLFRVRKSRPNVYYILIGAFLLLIMGLGVFMSIPDIHACCFSGFFDEKLTQPLLEKIWGQLKSGENIIAWLFGFILMILGYWVGKAKWLLEYHFHYGELRRLFFISVGLVFVWGILHYLNYYNFLKSFKVGVVFYLFDALSVHLLTVYIYLFVLIFLENFRIGIKILRFMAQLGKLWFMNILFLFGFIFIANYFQLNFNTKESIIIALIGFIISGLVSLWLGASHIRKLNIGI